MNAVISGRAAVAMLVEGDRFSSIHAQSPGRIIPRERWEYPFLFNGVDDIEFLEDVEFAEVVRQLTRATRRERALYLALVLIDGTWTAATRRSASEDLNGLLAWDDVKLFVESILWSLPLPPDSAVQSGQLLSVGERTRELLGTLVRAQTGIREIRIAWESSLQLLTEGTERTFARARAVKAGLFHQMVAFRDRTADLDAVRNRASGTDFDAVPRAQLLLTQWASPLQDQWTRTQRIVSTYWGYLQQLHSPVPQIHQSQDVSMLSWPKPQREHLIASVNDTSPATDGGRDTALKAFNDLLEATARKLRRVRWTTRSLRASVLLFGIAILAILIAWKFLLVVVALIEMLFIIGCILLAVAVFVMLDRVYFSKVWANTLRIQQEFQSRREEFELAWALSMAPLLRTKLAPSTSSSTDVVRERLLRQLRDESPQKVSPLDEAHAALSTPAFRLGGLRIVVSDINELKERSFILQIGRLSAQYTGTNSVALTLLAGEYNVLLKGNTKVGRATQGQMAVFIEESRIQEVHIKLV